MIVSGDLLQLGLQDVLLLARDAEVKDGLNHQHADLLHTSAGHLHELYALIHRLILQELLLERWGELAMEMLQALQSLPYKVTKNNLAASR